MTRRLSLRGERLAELTTSELESVVGGLPTQVCTGYYTSLNAPCATTLVPPTTGTV